VIETPHLVATRASYDTVAESYAELLRPDDRRWVLELPLLGAFVELVGAGRPVADVGCGPGRVTALLDGLGVAAFGVDLSPRMVEIARRTYPGLRFDVGSMTALDLADGELGGILAWWSIFHTPPDELPVVFGEFHRTLAPGGHVLMGFHVGDEHLRPERAYGHPVSYEAYRLRPERVAELVGAAGLVVTTRLLWEADATKGPQACLLARKPG